MRGKLLKEKNKSIYESFFAQHKIIYSAPFISSRTWEIDSHYSGIAIKQKTTLRMYIWITSENWNNIQLWNIIYRDLSEQKYLERPLKEYAPYVHNIEKYIKNSGIQRDQWYRISILSELPRWVWMWFDSIFCLLISTIIHRLQTWNNIESIDVNSIHEDINNDKNSIYRISRYAQLLESQITWIQSSNSYILSALCPWKFPIVISSEDIQWMSKKELVSMQDYKYFLYPLHILFPDISNIHYSPVDYWVIYSGRPTLSEHITRDNSKEQNDVLENTISTFKHIIQNSSAQRKPTFYKNILKEFEKWNENIIHTLLGYNSFEVLQAIKKIYTQWYSEEDIKKLLLAITKTRHALNAAKRASSNLSALITCLQQFFGHRPDLLWISYNDSNTMGWSLFFVTPIEGLRKNIINTIHQAQFDFPWSELLYANWLDGVEENGIICEQDLLQYRKSEYIQKNMLVLELPNKNFTFWSHEHLIKENNLDVVLDTIHSKIYICWHKLTSKELHSQTASIEMLLEVIQNMWTDISNRQLPLSSYARSKNEMLGKIVLPLSKLVKEKTNKEFHLECYGWMYDYFLRLSPSQVTIWIIRSVHETSKVPSKA